MYRLDGAGGATMSDDKPSAISRREFIQLSTATLVTTPIVAGTQATALAATKTGSTTVPGYILSRLRQHGAEILFGVPGATCDPLFAAVQSSPMSTVIASSDLEAGYAADGYARMKGLAAVAATYGVGTLGFISVIAGAYAERSPVVVINGGPSAEDLRLQRELGTLFTHSIGREQADLAMFREVTEYAERAEHAADVPRIVDAAIRTAITAQRPVYIEIAKQLWDARCPAPQGTLDTALRPTGEETRLAASIVGRLQAAQRPALLIGIEVQRYGLEDQVSTLLDRLGVPWATTLLAKSVIAEQTPGFIGVYSGDRALPSVRRIVEESDGLLALGCVMGRGYRHLVTHSGASMVQAANHVVRLGRVPPVNAELGPLLTALEHQPWEKKTASLAHGLPGLSFDQRRAEIPVRVRGASDDRGMTYDEVLRDVSDSIDENLIVVTDTSLSMYPAAELNITGRKGFLCNAVWQSIGYSVAAAVGVGLAQGRRPLVICGDGGFQMTAQSLSTLAEQRIPAIVIVLDNGLYGIEQFLLDSSFFSGSRAPRPYLKLNRWDYAGLARSMGFEVAKNIDNSASFKEALAAAKEATSPTFLSVVVKAHDLPSELQGTA
jgi:indolepyruvate decarboxylase